MIESLHVALYDIPCRDLDHALVRVIGTWAVINEHYCYRGRILRKIQRQGGFLAVCARDSQPENAAPCTPLHASIDLEPACGQIIPHQLVEPAVAAAARISYQSGTVCTASVTRPNLPGRAWSPSTGSIRAHYSFLAGFTC